MAGRAWGSSSRLYSPPIMAGQATRLIARDSRLLDMASRASRSNSKGEKPSTFFSPKSANRTVPCLLSQSPSPRTSTIQSVPSRFSVFLPSRSPHASREQTWSPRESTTHSLPCRFSQSIQYVSLNPPANTTRFVPCLLSQNKPPRTSAIRSVPCRLSQSGLCDCLVQSKSST